MICSLTKLEDVNLKGKKVFISQPMRGKSESEIKLERKNLVEEVEKLGGKVVDSVFPEIEKDGYTSEPLLYLGESLKMLAKSDIAVFMPGWKEARGCCIEHLCCERYDINIIEV